MVNVKCIGSKTITWDILRHGLEKLFGIVPEFSVDQNSIGMSQKTIPRKGF